MSYKVDNAVIMAAGAASRFAPLSYEVPEVIVVTGYKSEQFAYLAEKCGVRLVHNPDWDRRNNTGSIHAVRDLLGSSYLCSADNYFTANPFEPEVTDSYYAAEYADGPTAEWCMRTDADGHICHVQIGGENAWYMMGHTFWSRDFTRQFLALLEREYDDPRKMSVRRYPPEQIFEFDSLDELRAFDPSYIDDARSPILADAAARLGCGQRDITGIRAFLGGSAEAEGFTFDAPGGQYRYTYKDRKIERI